MSRATAARALFGVRHLAPTLALSLALGAPACSGPSAQPASVPPRAVASAAPVSPAPFVGRLIAAGEGHACVIRPDGSVWCWGRDAIGMMHDEIAPRRVPGVDGATHLAAYNGADCATTSRGFVCWGDNLFGQVEPTPSMDYVRDPISMTTLGGTPAPRGALGPSGVCLITPSAVECRGDVGRPWRAPMYTRFGEIPEAEQGKNPISGAYTTAARAVPGVEGATQIAFGATHLCALMPDRSVRCLGDDSVGQLGRVERDVERYHPANPVPGLRDVVQIEAGIGATCARTSTGDVWCWGSDFHGQIAARDASKLVPVITYVTIPGDPHDRFAPRPIRVEGLPPARLMSVGATHVCVIDAGGDVRCWGANKGGQLGDGTTERRDAPVLMKGARGALDVAASSYGPEGHTCVLFEAGVVKCVGRSDSGVLGRKQKDRALELTEVSFR